MKRAAKRAQERSESEWFWAEFPGERPWTRREKFVVWVLTQAIRDLR